MFEPDLLTWLRGPGLQIASAMFVLGLTFRIIQNFAMGRVVDLAEPRGKTFGPGVAVIWRRSFFHAGMSYRGYFTLIAGYTFHIGFLVTLFFLSQHIVMFRSILGFGWPALPPAIIDIFTLLGVAALVAILIHRFVDPVVRQLSDYQDYLVWLLTILPLITGFLMMHPIGMVYKTAFTLHLLSVQLLLVAIPFTKLSHMLSIFVSRWYNGALAGFKGIKS
jgi:nitrate reductase gamma subunit